MGAFGAILLFLNGIYYYNFLFYLYLCFRIIESDGIGGNPDDSGRCGV